MHECSPRCLVCRRARARRQTLVGMAVQWLAMGVGMTWEAMLDEIALSPEVRAGIWAQVVEEEGGVVGEVAS